MGYSTAQLKQIAQDNPEELIQIITSYISDVQILVPAIEILAETKIGENLILPVIKRLLRHIHASVRESALIAVSSFYIDKELPVDILDRVKIISKSDPSSIVKSCAADILEDFIKM